MLHGNLFFLVINGFKLLNSNLIILLLNEIEFGILWFPKDTLRRVLYDVHWNRFLCTGTVSLRRDAPVM